MSALDTKFAAMLTRELKNWVVWANLHNWADNRDPYFDGATGEMVTASHEFDPTTGAWNVVEARHATPRDMRNWAGY